MPVTSQYNADFENEKLALCGRRLIFKTLNISVLLSKRQHSLVMCLLRGINDKAEIISTIWQGADSRKMNNSYNQLIFQLRSLFANHNLPADVIVTLPRHGLCFNPHWLAISNIHRQRMASIVNDHAAWL